MRLLEREEPLNPQERDELDAVDQALAGQSVDPRHSAWAELTTLIAAERPEADEDWAAELDRLEGSGFRRGGGGLSPRGILSRLDGMRPMRIAGPIGALATLAIVAVVAVSTLNEGDGSDLTSVPPAVPQSAAVPSGDVPSAAESGGSAASGSTGTGSSALDKALENSGLPPQSSADLAAGARELRPTGSAVPILPGGNAYRDGKIAPGTTSRKVDRDVQLSLTANPDHVRDVSDQVITITRSLHGIVASSQVTEAGKQSQATLQLTIPTRNLDTAIDQLTKLANVESMNENMEDITRPFVSARDKLDDLQGERRRLLQALGNATTDNEAEALRLQIDDVRHQISKAESALENVARRARLSNLSVTVTGDPNVKEDRDLGDWFDDAVSVLRDVAGVLLISAAIVIPLGILLTLGWIVTSWLRRRRRERALDS